MLAPANVSGTLRPLLTPTPTTSTGRDPVWDPARWLPTTRDELEARDWDYVDVIIVSGDAYVDHPAFGTAVIGRMIERDGLRVAIVPQPNWRDCNSSSRKRSFIEGRMKNEEKDLRVRTKMFARRIIRL